MDDHEAWGSIIVGLIDGTLARWTERQYVSVEEARDLLLDVRLLAEPSPSSSTPA